MNYIATLPWMDPASITAIFTGLAATITAAAGLIVSLRNGRRTDAVIAEQKETKAEVSELGVRVNGHMKKLLRATAHIASVRGKEIGRKDEVKRTQRLIPPVDGQKRAPARKPKRKP